MAEDAEICSGTNFIVRFVNIFSALIEMVGNTKIVSSDNVSSDKTVKKLLLSKKLHKAI